MIHHVKIPLPKGGVLKIGNDLPLVFLLGPCQMESRAHALETSAALKEMGDKYGIGIVWGWTKPYPFLRKFARHPGFRS